MQRQAGALNTQGCLKYPGRTLGWHQVLPRSLAGGGLAGTLLPFVQQQRQLRRLDALGVAKSDMDTLQASASRLAVAFGGDSTRIIAAAYNIQSAISDIQPGQLAAVTRAATIAGKATGATDETITQLFGIANNIFSNRVRSQGRVAFNEQLAGVTSETVRLFKTNGQKISTAFAQLGASATTMGVSLEEQFAVLGQFSNLTRSGGEAATRYRAFLKGAAKAQETLGLNFADANGNILPLINILDQLKKRFGQNITLAQQLELQKAFGSDEAVAFVSGLLQNTAGLRKNLAKIKAVRGISPALTAANKLIDPWQQLSAAAKEFAIAIGSAIGPDLERFLNWAKNTLHFFTALIRQLPNLTRLVLLLATAFFALRAAQLGLGLSKLLRGRGGRGGGGYLPDGFEGGRKGRGRGKGLGKVAGLVGGLGSSLFSGPGILGAAAAALAAIPAFGLGAGVYRSFNPTPEMKAKNKDFREKSYLYKSGNSYALKTKERPYFLTKEEKINLDRRLKTHPLLRQALDKNRYLTAEQFKQVSQNTTIYAASAEDVTAAINRVTNGQ